MGATTSTEDPAPEPTDIQARPGHHSSRRVATGSSTASSGAGTSAPASPTSNPSSSASNSATTQKDGDDDDDDDDEPDDWDKRIFSTGCADEQLKMNDCYYEKRDWRVCSKEMEAFRECWKRNGNDMRTSTKNA